MRTSKLARHAATAFTAALVALGISAGTANAADVTGSGYSYLAPDPYDAGGYDAIARLNYDGVTKIAVRFHAYDEYLRLGNTTGSDAYVNVFYTPKGSSKTYEYNFHVGRDSSWRKELGNDGDLNEGGSIRIQLCTLLNCSGWYWGTT
ncbi:hypothetical protein [Streptomyces sp. NPDC001933]|uniref:hypothetical protein n=1 Tax=Streptomyces sp. NPDC001933 TaxID=3364626 RepID=UPI0036A21AF4